MQKSLSKSDKYIIRLIRNKWIIENRKTKNRIYSSVKLHDVQEYLKKIS